MASKKFVPRQRKRRVLDKLRAASAATDLDTSTAEIIITPSKTAREERKAKLKEEVLAQHGDTKVSRQKQKRLDKYIQNKLHKEEKADLLKRIVGAQNGVDRSLLKSTKLLGRGREERREVLQRAVQERASGINVQHAESVLFDKKGPAAELKDSSSEEENENDGRQEMVPMDQVLDQPMEPEATFGSGLKRPLELDDDGRPMIKKRKRGSGKGFKIDLQTPTDMLVAPETLSGMQAEDDWEGFDSDATGKDKREGWDDIGYSETDSDDVSESGTNDSEQSEDESDVESGSSVELENGASGSDDPSEAEAEQEQSGRRSAFKAWAENQRNDAIGFHPSNVLADVQEATKKIAFTPRPAEEDPLPEALKPLESSDRRAHAVAVHRTEEIQAIRLALPVVAKEQEIMEAIFNNDVVIVSGATGSGKTTQIPQFLLENGFGDTHGPTPGMIGVTQPRRVAAVSMAKRVADELGDHKDVVAHQIRFDSTLSSKTAIKFMTDGVLLREMANDFALKRYSAIVIDEAHERTVNTDILISLMSRCIKARSQLAKQKAKLYTPLKLIIMSATLRVSDFRENSRLFSIPPPLVQAEGRQFDVTVHWSRRTHVDFVEEAYKKVSRGHRKLPPGGILVFLTGQNEIRLLAQRLRQTFSSTRTSTDTDVHTHVSALDMVIEPEDLATGFQNSEQHDDDEESYLDNTNGDSDVDEIEDPDDEFKIEGEEAGDLSKIHVLPLYSQLPSKEQLRVFETPPEGSRLIVLATNVAETSLTIPGIRYVFDSGRVKERKWDRAGVQIFTTTWVSKASADQRTGRAGRTGPGHCYRLYSSAMYEGFEDFAEPEIYRSPLGGVVLQLKALNIIKIDNFPFPTPPDRSNMLKAEQVLRRLGALDSKSMITALGKELQTYPLSPRFAQMLRLGRVYNCTNLAIAMVAVLDMPEVIIAENMVQHLNQPDEESSNSAMAPDSDTLRKAYGQAQGHLSQLSPVSDAMKLLMALITYSKAEAPEVASEQYFLRSKALKEANQLREQLHNILNSLQSLPSSNFSPSITPPSAKEVGVLRQIVAAGFIDQVAIRADCLPSPPEVERKPKRAIDVRYCTLLPSHDATEITSEDEKYVYLHPSSLLARTAANKVPRYVVYQRLQRSQSSSREGGIPRTRMHPLTPVSGEQLAVLARGTSLISVGKPVGKIQQLSHVNGKERRQCSVVISLIGRAGDVGWPLVRKDVIQRREPGEGWVVEKYND